VEARLTCTFTGCGRPLDIGGDGAVRHAEPPPDGVRRHPPHFTYGGAAFVDLTESGETAP
jgi:hypothetical protein